MNDPHFTTGQTKAVRHVRFLVFPVGDRQRGACMLAGLTLGGVGGWAGVSSIARLPVLHITAFVVWRAPQSMLAPESMSKRY